MFIAPLGRVRLALPLAVLCSCLAPLPAMSDEVKYMPDNAQFINSLDIATAMKSKAMAEIQKLVPSKSPDDPLGVGLGKITRVTRAASWAPDDNGSEEVYIATLLKPTTADEVKALKKPEKYQKNFAFKEIKVGANTIYVETYQVQFSPDEKLGKVTEGMAFFLAEGKYVVSAHESKTLKQIIERNKEPMLSPVVRAGLKDAGLSNIANLVIDFKNLPARDRDQMLTMFMGLSTAADIKASAAKVEGLIATVNEPGKVKATVTLICSDAAGAGTIKGIAERTLADVKVKMKMDLKEDPKKPLPADMKKFFANVRTLLDAIEISSAGNRVVARAEVDPVTAFYGLGGWWLMRSSDPAERDEPAPSPKEAPGETPKKK